MALIFKEHNVDIDTQITLFQTRELYDTCTQNIESVHMLQIIVTCSHYFPF